MVPELHWLLMLYCIVKFILLAPFGHSYDKLKHWIKYLIKEIEMKTISCTVALILILKILTPMSYQTKGISSEICLLRIFENLFSLTIWIFQNFWIILHSQKRVTLRIFLNCLHLRFQNYIGCFCFQLISSLSSHLQIDFIIFLFCNPEYLKKCYFLWFL